MYLLNNNDIKEIEETTFASIDIREKDLEEILRKNINMICDPDDESMLIIGQQVANEKRARSDLTAIDSEGNIVVIEIKRDLNDLKHRKERVEFQAIRYAASCATINSIDTLVQEIFQPYVENHLDEFSCDPYESLNSYQNSYQIAQRAVREFMESNEIDPENFNRKQRIILIASEFDDQTLSAAAWLNSNKINISCYEIKPYRTTGENIILDLKKILPLAKTSYEDFYIPIYNRRGHMVRSPIKRKVLLKIEDLLRLNLIKPDTVLVDTRLGTKATLQSDGSVRIASTGEIKSIQNWLKSIYNWSAVQSFKFLKVENTGKLLYDLREEYYESDEEALDPDGETAGQGSADQSPDLSDTGSVVQNG